MLIADTFTCQPFDRAWAIGNLDRTPRWTAYEAKRFGIKLKEEIPVVTVERAYTSPIWYTP